jgi:hypothetical protein
MRAIQLKCYHTGRPAPEADRQRIQAVIDRLQKELDEETNTTEQSSLRWRIGALQGQYRMPRG